jgi:hypothetical protein
MNKFPHTSGLLKLEYAYIKNLNNKINNEIKLVVKILPRKKSPEPECFPFTTEFYQTFKELVPIFPKVFYK